METKEVSALKTINGRDAIVTVRVPVETVEGQPFRVMKKDVVSIEYLDERKEFKSGRLPRKEKKKLKKHMGLQGKSRARIVKKTINKTTGDFSVRINKR